MEIGAGVNFAHLIPVFPFAAFLVNILLGRSLKKGSAFVSIFASAFSFFLSVMTFIGLLKGGVSYTLFSWLALGRSSLDIGVMVDPLTCVMLLVVTIVGTLIQIYSVGYMHDDKRFSRFFAYLSLFMSSMLGLLLADNFLVLFIFWEAVGVCSYLLISFWFEKISAARAGMKAFITTKIGDVGFFIGMMVLFSATGSLYFKDLPVAGEGSVLLTVAAFLIFSGAVGKSAQFPLHTWLPDAMEGPTPVSALIHAATMVAAGVYLVARSFPLFVSHQPSLVWVAYIGAFSAFMAATIASVNDDIKRILAYSTISQLGLMMLGLGTGGYSAGVFHLVTHAFFKALLFLCAGSVIHSLRIQDIQKMGGLLSKMKITGAAFIIAGLAISGIPPFSGFWSKDEILSMALENGHPILFAVALVTGLLTSFYMFRLIFLVLFGKERSEFQAHESPMVMTTPLVVLALFAVFSGFLGSPFCGYAFQKFLHLGAHNLEAMRPDYPVMAISTLAGILGIGLAYTLYIRNNKILSASARAKFAQLYKVISNKYYFDEIYALLIIRPSIRMANIFFRFDLGVIDSLVDKAALLTVVLSRIKGWIDLYIVDGLVNAAAMTVGFFSEKLRKIQTGLIQNYLLAAFLGVIIIAVFKIGLVK